MENRSEERTLVEDRRRARHRELLRRLNSDEELLGMPKARTEPAEEERRRKFNNEVEREQEYYRGWWMTGRV